MFLIVYRAVTPHQNEPYRGRSWHRLQGAATLERSHSGDQRSDVILICTLGGDAPEIAGVALAEYW